MTEDIRIGQIIRAELNAKARKPAYKLWIDFGELGTKTSSAQITDLYRPEGLVGRVIVAVLGLGSRNVAGFESEVLVLGVQNLRGEVVLLAVDQDAPLGAKVH
ncbi:MAG: tRNA-binding protein [Fimbriimonas sp.]